jgi:hypothetical protein
MYRQTKIQILINKSQKKKRKERKVEKRERNEGYTKRVPRAPEFIRSWKALAVHTRAESDIIN